LRLKIKKVNFFHGFQKSEKKMYKIIFFLVFFPEILFNDYIIAKKQDFGKNPENKCIIAS
jgi:hypothetical protein